MHCIYLLCRMVMYRAITSASLHQQAKKKGNSQSLFYIFLDNTLHIFTLPKWLCIEQHYILVIAHLGMRNAHLGTSNAEKIENLLFSEKTLVSIYIYIFTFRMLT